MKSKKTEEGRRERNNPREAQAIASLARDSVGVYIVTLIHEVDPLKGVFLRSRMIVGPYAGNSFMQLVTQRFPDADIDAELTRLAALRAVRLTSIGGGRDMIVAVDFVGKALLRATGIDTNDEPDSEPKARRVTRASLSFWTDSVNSSYIIGTTSPEGVSVPVARLHVDDAGFDLYIAEGSAGKRSRPCIVRLAQRLSDMGDIRFTLLRSLKKRKLSLFQATAGALVAVGVKPAKPSMPS